MLAAESISNEKGLTHYWNEACQENSSLLWLPTKTALQDLDTTCSKESLSAMGGKSWYSMKSHLAPQKSSHKICLQSFTSFRAGFAGLETTKKSSKNPYRKPAKVSRKKSRKVRLYPAPEQKLSFNLWFEASRWTYNKAKEICDKCRESKLAAPNLITLRKQVLEEVPERLSGVPFLVKAGGVVDYMNARSNAASKYKQTGEIQEVHFRSRKNPEQSCWIKPESVTKDGVYPRLIGKQKQSEYYKPVGECVLKRHNGRYTVFVIIENTPACETQASGEIVSIDPGIRTFLTWYSGEGCGKIGENDFTKLFRLCMQMDALISRRSKSRNHRQRRGMKRAIGRLRNRITELVNELHQKAALFFARNFDVILLPAFETKGMAQRGMRKINSKTARMMLTFSHYKFKRFLKHKAREHGKIVVEVNEAYTSQTVSWTGEVKDIGGARNISSGRGAARVVVDRDYNGARGIMLRALRASSMKAI